MSFGSVSPVSDSDAASSNALDAVSFLGFQKTARSKLDRIYAQKRDLREDPAALSRQTRETRAESQATERDEASGVFFFFFFFFFSGQKRVARAQCQARAVGRLRRRVRRARWPQLQREETPRPRRGERERERERERKRERERERERDSFDRSWARWRARSWAARSRARSAPYARRVQTVSDFAICGVLSGDSGGCLFDLAPRRRRRRSSVFQSRSRWRL